MCVYMYIHVISVMAQFIYSRPTANNVTVAAIVYETCAYIYIYTSHTITGHREFGPSFPRIVTDRERSLRSRRLVTPCFRYRLFPVPEMEMVENGEEEEEEEEQEQEQEQEEEQEEARTA